MMTLPLLMTKASKKLFRAFREIAYEDMARQASDWIPEEARIASPLRQSPPITLDFDIPKKHRLGWISRTFHQLSH